jgi:hypothetical protein
MPFVQNDLPFDPFHASRKTSVTHLFVSDYRFLDALDRGL